MSNETYCTCGGVSLRERERMLRETQEYIVREDYILKNVEKAHAATLAARHPYQPAWTEDTNNHVTVTAKEMAREATRRSTTLAALEVKFEATLATLGHNLAGTTQEAFWEYVCEAVDLAAVVGMRVGHDADPEVTYQRTIAEIPDRDCIEPRPVQ